MSGQTSTKTAEAIAMLRQAKGSLSAYAAAKAVGIALSTMYRSPLYKQWKAERDQQPKDGKRRN